MDRGNTRTLTGKKKEDSEAEDNHLRGEKKRRGCATKSQNRCAYCTDEADLEESEHEKASDGSVARFLLRRLEICCSESLLQRGARIGTIRSIFVVAVRADIHAVQHDADQVSAHAADSGLLVKNLLARRGPALNHQEDSVHQRSEDAAIGQGKHRRRIKIGRAH